MKNKNDIVALNDSQILRWLCELNKLDDLDTKVSNIKYQIKLEKKKPKTKETKERIKKLYEDLYNLQYQKDYNCLIMDSNSDYDRANKGYSINGIKFKRLLGTNGGIKKSTITYINEDIYAEIKKRMDCGRNMKKEIVPAKLEAYQAFICSGSIPVSKPRIIVVNDCVTNFYDDVIKLDDSNTKEPEMKHINNYPIELADSDGYGFMTPEYSRKINGELNGSDFYDKTISGVNTRYAWVKGMIYTFDFIEFANQKNNGNYIVKDAWGEERDARNADVILTTSMLKLWDFYDNFESYDKSCTENNYQFSVAKAMPQKLENVRNSNYQFLQDYEFTDDELLGLCQPTFNEIDDVLGGDYRKSIAFLKGLFLNDDNVNYIDNDFVKALMVDNRMIDDPFVINKIHQMIKKRIYMAAKGSLKIAGNFQIISGDLYSLAQSMFGHEVTGLLKRGEIYSRYWVDKNINEVSLFRAPMTCHNNIRKVNVVRDSNMDYWYQYNRTGMILNSWDTICNALNGADKDSDTFFSTNNEIILRNTRNDKTIECIQRKANKIVSKEEDLVRANKLAFGDEIGTTTNHVTGMIEVRAGFPIGSDEYSILDYRIKCGQLYQQNAIDKAKGIIAKSMPKQWYDRNANKISINDTNEMIEKKKFNLTILADKKPYFMKYIYPDLMQRYNNYIKRTNNKCIREFKMTMDELLNNENRTPEEESFVVYYYKLMPVGINPCVINKICWLFENKYNNFLSSKVRETEFDYNILKSGVEYSKNDYKMINYIYSTYLNELKEHSHLSKKKRVNKDDAAIQRQIMIDTFKMDCEKICSNEKELCDIVLDLCYKTNRSKQFAWDICGKTIVDNLLEKNNSTLNYPKLVDTEEFDFEFAGENFKMCKKNIKEVDDLL